MKLLIIGALVTIASALRVDKEHKTIFQGCSNDSDCGADKWCNTDAALWNYCMDCCYLPNGNGCLKCK